MAYRWGGPPGGQQGWGGVSTGGGGGETPVGIGYTFDDGTSAAGISNGQVRFNNATAGSITAIYIAQTDANGNDMGTVLATFSAGGLLYVNVTGDDTAYSVFKVTACADSGTYYTLTGTYLSGVLPNDGGAVRVTIAPVEVTGVKKYVARVTQSSTDAPSSVSLYVDGIGISWQYISTGYYTSEVPEGYAGYKSWKTGPGLGFNITAEDGLAELTVVNASNTPIDGWTTVLYLDMYPV